MVNGNLTLKKIVKSPTHRVAETGRRYSLQVIAKEVKEKRAYCYRHYIRIVLHTKRASYTKTKKNDCPSYIILYIIIIICNIYL